MSELDRDDWATLLDGLEEPPLGTVAEALADARDLDVGSAYDRVEAALEDGALVEEDAAGAFDVVRVVGSETSGDGESADEDAGEGGSSGDDPEGETERIGVDLTDWAGWMNVDFSDTESDTYAPELLDREQWMGRKDGDKKPFAPWGEKNPDTECNAQDCDADRADADDCECDGRYKWGFDGHYVDGETVALAEDDPRLAGRVFIQRERDPYAFVDGDSVRCPETGRVHPAFKAILAHLGATYGDVSTSGTGAHAQYRGEIPLDGVKAPAFDIDTEPWGANDEPPTVEIYAGKHVCVTTGDHVAGTPLGIAEWDADALADILRANGYEETEDVSAERESLDLEDYEPTATTSDETTDETRDVFRALDRLDPKRVGERTIVSEWTNGRRSFLPTWGSSSDNGTANYIDDRIWHDTGRDGGYGGPAVMAAIDAGLVNHAGVEPRDVSGETFFEALEHLRDLGFSIPRLEESSPGHDTAEEAADDDPRELGATVDPRRAWDAAGRVTPAEVDGLEAAAEDAERFASPAGPVDVVRAVALAEDLLDDAEGALDDAYPEAYELAREKYGAPLPEYYTTSDAIAEFDAVLDVIGEVSFFQLDPERFSSEVTEEGDEVGGDAVRALNPAWRESESEASVLVFESGTIWDADTERVLDAVRFAALDTGVIEEPGDPLAGEAFVHAYGVARDVLGAPLPRWDPATDGARELTPQLPPSEELVEARDLGGVDPDELQLAREEVEELIRDATGEADEPTVVTSLPATGKTTGTVKTAALRALSYLAPRKELQAQALAKAERWGVDAEVLPVFSERRVRDEVLAAAVSHVRERGKGRLRDRWAILTSAFDDLDDDEELDELDAGDIFTEEDDEDDIDLDRPTCETAEGEHGVGWALAVHVARRLGYTPREIHAQARGLFGASLPCDHGEGETCEYADGWDRVTDADDPADLLVGSYTHAHVDSVRTEFTRASDGSVETAPRAVVLDEFVGEAFVGEFDEKAMDFATWLGGCLREDVGDRWDVLETDLAADPFVTAWLDGEAGEADDAVDEALESLAHSRDLLDAREAAREIRDEVDTETLRELGLADALDAVLREDAAAAYDALETAIGAVDRNAPAAGIARWADDEVREPLETATAAGRESPPFEEGGDAVSGLAGSLGIDGDLATLVDQAVVALSETREDARDRLDAAVTALRGGPEGCRRLAAWADDGYAHPEAHHILEAVVAEEPDRVVTDSWAFDPDATDGTVVDVTETGDRATTVLDRNGHGARIHTPPARTDASGADVPLVGLDATGRAPLWSVALGEDVSTDDIHDTARERAQFLENVLDLRVIQAADRPRPYEGDPSSKDTDGDVALLEAIAEEYAGIDAPRERGDAPSEVGRPAAITTKSVRELLESDDRLDDVVAGWDHYGNVTGKNELGEHRLAAILGSQHYGDDAVERFAALAGESVDTSRTGGRGAALSYGSDLAGEYLAHMREDQTTQAILRFARGDSGATVVARTSALRADLPVVGEGQVVETWNDTATTIAEEYRRLGREFTTADVRDVVDVTPRQVRRVLAELTEAGYVRRLEESAGRATTYERVDDLSAGEVELPARTDAVGVAPGHNDTNLTYTWNVRVHGGDPGLERSSTPGSSRSPRGPPAPSTVAASDGGEPPG